MSQSNLRPLIRKLQQALAIQQGRRISMSIFQSYSPRAQRTVSKYILSEQRIDDDGKARYHTLIQSWSLPEIVKRLAAELNGPDQHGGDDSAVRTNAQGEQGQPEDIHTAPRPKMPT